MWHNTYFLVPAVLLVAAALYAPQTKQAAQRVPQAKGLPGRGLPLLDTAFLSGGPGRVFDTAFVRMHQSGRVVVNRDGLVTLTGGRPYDSVEEAIIEALGPTGQRELAPLRRAVMRSAAVQKLGDGLAHRGLLRNPVLLRRAKVARRPLWLALLVVVLSTVLAYVLDNGEADRPALWIPAVLLIVGLASVIVSWPLKGRITPAGRRQLALMDTGKPWTPADAVTPLATGAALLGAIALGGLAASGLEDAELQEAMLAAAAAEEEAARVAAGMASSTASSSSGSSSNPATWCGASSDSGSSGSGCGSSSGSGCGSSSGSCGSSSSSGCGSSSSSCGSSSSSSCGSSCGGGSSCSS
ncbi:TIGR04222 domain-containing membrane protein [Kitasatospora sp. RG8]|uniref:TIGR04222 domain-containing membrane protein n=1 Tax=Kitasatospora sp. RG8 TaxID=2820815 RepID=UPI001ADFE1C4|nr:TIGR04222 domain-containing membrane protein [Kitasatospora sp. RG8]MBP0449960.1 TIGR04222 domain-containing membrane protein [Kitasatospora sp. RG8]